MSSPLGELRPIDGGEPLPLFEERILIGSHRLCDIVIRSVQVAPLHCQLYIRNARWHVRDFTGTDDTRVNSLPARDERLNSGDVLWIGSRHKYEVYFDTNDLLSLIPVLYWPGESAPRRSARWRMNPEGKPQAKRRRAA